VLEEAWVRDTVDLIWEAVRLRRLKAALMTSSVADGMVRVLCGLQVGGTPFTLSRDWAARKLEAVAQADQILDAAGLGIDHVMAETLHARIDVIERIDRMAASAEARRAAALREIAHYRADFAVTLRLAADAAIEHAAYEEVAAEGAAGTAQAAG